MFKATGNAKYNDVLERTLYNSILSSVSLSGTEYFYTNPLKADEDLPFKLRWPNKREEFISLSNCCPPNIVRTIGKVNNYAYSVSENGVWVNLYGANSLSTTLPDGSNVKLNQATDYPWEGKVNFTMNEVPDREMSVYLRIPEWADGVKLKVNGKQAQDVELKAGNYAEVKRSWSEGDEITLNLSLEAKLVEAHPMVESNINQVAVQRGPMVYALESVDLPEGVNMENVVLPADIKFNTEKITIDQMEMVSLKGKASIIKEPDWGNSLYRELPESNPKKKEIKLIPYYAWANRGSSDMTVWLPVSR